MHYLYRFKPLARIGALLALGLPLASFASPDSVDTEIPAQTVRTQGQSQSSDAEVQQVLVVGARLARPVRDVVGKVDLIGREQLLQDMSDDAQSFVRYLPGISVNEQDSRFGGTEFVIRGLGGNRVVTLIDGIPMADRFSVGAYANTSQDFLIPDLVSQVEILRGPASTLFGTDALGGVMAIVTRDPEQIIADNGLSTQGSAVYSGADSSRALSAGLAGRRDNSSFLLQLYDQQGNERRGSTGTRDPQDRHKRSANLKLHQRLSNYDLLRLKLDWFQEEVDSDLRTLLGYSTRFANTTELLGADTRNRHSIGLGYEFDRPMLGADLGRMDLYFQRTAVDQRSSETRALAPQPVFIWRRFDYQHDTLGTSWDFQRILYSDKLDQRLGWGLSASHTKITQLRDAYQTNLNTQVTTKTVLGETFPLRDFPDSRVEKYALYVHDEIILNNWRWLPALRYELHRLRVDRDSVFDAANPEAQPVDLTASALAPKLGVIWDVNSTSSLYGQYARGFRSPPFQDVNLTLEIDTPMFSYRALPNPDLKAETSNGFELGLRQQHDTWQGQATAFTAYYDNLIESRVNLGLDPDSGFTLFQSRNISKAKIYGMELSGQLWLDQLVTGLSLQSQLVWTRGKNRQTGAPLNSVDPTEIITRLRWRANENWHLGVHVTAVEAPRKVDTTSNPYQPSGYGLLDLTTSYAFSDRLRLDAGLFNVTDKTHYRWASVRHRAADDPSVDALSGNGRYLSLALRYDY